MAHIVFVTYGITSYLNSSYALAAGLQARGHRVTYLSSLDVGDAVRMQGFEFVLLEEEHRIRQDPERLALERMPGRQRYRHRAALIRVGRRQRQYYLESDEWQQQMAALQPDLLLIDEELPERILQAVSLNIPLLLLQYFSSTRRRDGTPPLHTALLPAENWQGRLAIAGQWQWLLIKRRLIETFAPLYYAGTDRRSILRALAGQTGYQGRIATRHWFPFVFPDIETLFLTAPEFDFPHDGQVDGAYVGPMVWLDRVDGREMAAELDNFLGRNADSPRPLIYASLGTFWQTNVAFLQRVIDAFRLHPEWDLVLAIGRQTAPAAFGETPSNVLLRPYAPQLQVLAQADVALTHGGIGTINECITLGVPMILYATGKVDQNGNAARAYYHGLGLRGDIGAESAEAIASRIAQVLSGPTFVENVARFQRIYAQYEAEDRAVSLIEARLPEIVSNRGVDSKL